MLQDYTIQPPTQELVVRDLHDNTWTFRHIYRGKDAFDVQPCIALAGNMNICGNGRDTTIAFPFNPSCSI